MLGPASAVRFLIFVRRGLADRNSMRKLALFFIGATLILLACPITARAQTQISINMSSQQMVFERIATAVHLKLRVASGIANFKANDHQVAGTYSFESPGDVIFGPPAVGVFPVVASSPKSNFSFQATEASLAGTVVWSQLTGGNATFSTLEGILTVFSVTGAPSDSFLIAGDYQISIKFDNFFTVQGIFEAGGFANAHINSGVLSVCPIKPLTSLDELAATYCSDVAITRALENNPIRTDLYDQNMQTQIADFQARLRTAGFPGNFLTGTFRTKAYQAHLREVWDRWREIAPPIVLPSGCSVIDSTISSQFKYHFPTFCCRPGYANSSKPGAIQHTAGRALDVNIRAIRAAGIDTSWGGELDQIARDAGFYRPYPFSDKVHFEPMFPVPTPSPQICSGSKAETDTSITYRGGISESVAAAVSIKVSQQNVNGRPAYFYRIVNNAVLPIISLTVGYDQPNDNPELTVAPLGWDFDNGIPQTSVLSPAGWDGGVIVTEENNYLQLRWSSSDQSHTISPGQTINGFGVTLPNTDNSYVNSHWIVTFADGTTYSDALEPLSAATGDTVQFFQGVYAVNRDAGYATITVTRSGPTANAATVDFATTDGTANQTRNYTSASGTLRFAPSETNKSFSVLIAQDAYLEPDETVNLDLRNASGVLLGNLAFATLIINHNNPSSIPSGNPIDDAHRFVQQHYYDFLSRYPDQSGWDFWTKNINNCAPKPSCVDLQRINTSAAYFLSNEFQQTGYLVERLYKAAYADVSGASNFGTAHQLSVPIVRFNEFLSDTQQIGQGVIVGQTGWETVLENNKQTFAAQFAQRSRFASTFATSMTPAQFVDALFANAGVTPTAADRNAAVAEFGSATNTSDVTARARAFRKVAENSTLVTNEFNRAFVLMQFFGYLRRDPNSGPDTDYTGYDFWLTKLNQFNGNFVSAEMVKAFITSIEYRQRFGP